MVWAGVAYPFGGLWVAVDWVGADPVEALTSLAREVRVGLVDPFALGVCRTRRRGARLGRCLRAGKLR